MKFLLKIPRKYMIHSQIKDVDDVKYVINYDYPNNSEDYIHRIGK